ncbi:MAG TPA: hypothetical protein VL098_13565 [Flavipsychrobacter sp.]|nr:hypothetical protein [Flavipsychrobacter sp.]
MRIERFILIFAVLVSCFGKSVVAQPDVTIHAKLDAVDITVGDQIKMFIEARSNGNSTLQWAFFPDTFNKLEIVERGKIDTSKQGATIIYKQRLLISGYDSGLFQVPPFRFSVLPKGSTPYTISTDSFLVSVTTVPVDTSKAFRGIKDIMAVKTDWKEYLPWIIGGLLLLALLVVLIRKLIKRKPAPVAVPAAPSETLHQRTLRLLEELDSRKLWQSGNVKLYYIELTDILRSYIELRFKTPAMELTTDELLNKSHDHKEMSKYYDELSQILHTADLAKFAKAQPLPYEHTQALEQTRQFVNATKPVIVETTHPSS